MWTRLHLTRISWSLADQGIVSIGSFLVNVLLARELAAEDYGMFALLFGGMLTLQVVNSALLFHPFAVRLVVADADDHGRLLSASLALIALLSGCLSVVLAVVLATTGQAVLILPALAAFLTWQLQEGLRRGLLSTFRYRAATLGDGLSYLGQGAVVILLARLDVLTLETALYSMAATSTMAAAVQVLQLRPYPLGRLHLRRTMADYWMIGGGWSIGNAMLLQGRAQLLLFGLAAAAGTAAVASFQAAANAVNLLNPILFALCNIIPQTASEGRGRGNAEVWRTVRGYCILAAPPILAYAAVLLAVPGQVLELMYGPGSSHLDMTLAVRVLILAALAGYAADVAVAFLHGLTAMRLAFAINAAGALATLVLAVPLIGTLGVLGNCLTHVGANAVRLIAARRILGGLLEPAPSLVGATSIRGA
ncbi:hypothetical protein ACFQS7_17855 [Dankookia sp. GCM10030260]|uniref:hypothetical protein n=1 Tax=Dankookia sp. GCM10030260 TaxID=3273390 RepID=UPI003617B928